MTIRNDATRQRIVPADPRALRQVVARQGQVLLDADLDQQATHILDRIETETSDILGRPDRLVYPAGTTAFLVTPSGAPSNFDIGAGHGYLDGWLVENATTCKLTTQPHPRSGDVVTAPAIVGIKALIRHIDPVEDAVLADRGLGDAQAAGRALIDWQVFPVNVAAGADFGCGTAAAAQAWQRLIAPSTGTLGFVPDTAPPASDPCTLIADGGYTRLENLLYRIEVHGGIARADFPTVDGPRFGLDGLRLKLSRRNASVMVRITGLSGADLTVAPAALDPLNWFAPGQFAEIVSPHDDPDPRAALVAERLFRVAVATDTVVTLEASPAQISATLAFPTLPDNAGGWFLRLWDMFPAVAGLGAGIVTVAAPGGAAQSQLIDLGDGVRIRLAGGAAATFRRGDFWTCAARADGRIDWPVLVPQVPPHGPETRYAVLAALKTPATAPVVDDCRIPFASLTDRVLHYRGGDGQSALAPLVGGPVRLSALLRVAVLRGETPVKGAGVEWRVTAGAPACQIDGQNCGSAAVVIRLTNDQGMIEVPWDIDAAQKFATHRVEARLIGPTGPLPAPVHFTARFQTAEETSYTPGTCIHLQGIGTVKAALDALCEKVGGAAEVPTLTLGSIRLVNKAGVVTELIKENLILNAQELAFDAFVTGIGFGVLGGPVKSQIAPFDPIVEVELDLPYAFGDAERSYWLRASKTVRSRPALTGAFGFQRVRLDGTVKVIPQDGTFEEGLLWTPSDMAQAFLATVSLHLAGQRIVDPGLAEEGWKGDPFFDLILCRLRVRSAYVWTTDDDNNRIYLNAEYLGIPDRITGRELDAKTRDPQRAADLDMFIYLRVERG